MAKDKNVPRYDKQGARRIMRKRDYLADFGGQLALGLMANLVGQLNYFYTDKVGLAVGSVGIVLAISKVIDAFTDVIAGILSIIQKEATISISDGSCRRLFRQP